MDIGKSFSYVFEDEQWVSKVLIGGLILFIPFANFAVAGYMIKTAQNVAQGHARPLPEWGEFGDHFMRGLYWLVIALVYSLPAILLGLVFSCLFGGAASSVESESGAGALGLLMLCFMPLFLLVTLGGSLLSYSALLRYAATGQLNEAFKFGAVVAGVRNHLGDWLMLLVVAILAGVVSGLGMVACGVGVLFTSFYAQCVLGHALGQMIARQGLAGAGQVPPYGAPPSYQ